MRARTLFALLCAPLLAAPRPALAQSCGHGCPPAQRDARGCCPARVVVTVTATELRVSQQIHFQIDSPVVLPESAAALDAVAQALVTHADILLVEVQGHTDNVGAETHNQALSQSRADAVRAALIQRGVDAARLIARGYGASRPVGPNITPPGRTRNRRIAFVILRRRGGP